jgi:hypothetical protein
MGRPDGSNLAPATIHRVVQLMNKCINAAFEDRLIPHNPVAKLPLPRIERREMRFLDTDEVWRLADSIDRRYRGFVLLGPSEVCASVRCSASGGVASTCCADGCTSRRPWSTSAGRSASGHPRPRLRFDQWRCHRSSARSSHSLRASHSTRTSWCSAPPTGTRFATRLTNGARPTRLGRSRALDRPAAVTVLCVPGRVGPAWFAGSADAGRDHGRCGPGEVLGGVGVVLG